MKKLILAIALVPLMVACSEDVPPTTERVVLQNGTSYDLVCQSDGSCTKQNMQTAPVQPQQQVQNWDNGSDDSGMSATEAALLGAAAGAVAGSLASNRNSGHTTVYETEHKYYNSQPYNQNKSSLTNNNKYSTPPPKPTQVKSTTPVAQPANVSKFTSPTNSAKPTPTAVKSVTAPAKPSYTPSKPKTTVSYAPTTTYKKSSSYSSTPKSYSSSSSYKSSSSSYRSSGSTSYRSSSRR